MSRRRHRFDLVLFVALLAVVLTQASAAAPLASAVSPASGAVTSAKPVFVASVVSGDLPLEIQVAKSSAVTHIGFQKYVALCIPTKAGSGRVRGLVLRRRHEDEEEWVLPAELVAAVADDAVEIAATPEQLARLERFRP